MIADSYTPNSWSTRLMRGILSVACVVVLWLSWYRETQIRDGDVRIAEVETSNLARSLVQQAEDSIELVDNALIGIVHWLENFGDRPQAIKHLQELLLLRKATLPRLRGLFVYDANGDWLATSEGSNISGHNNSDRDYFKYHRANADRQPYIGSPVISKSGGQWILTVSRRMDGPDGRFSGVALASIDVSYFVDKFRRFDVGSQGSLALLRSDGTLLARYPVEEHALGRNFSGSPFFRHVTAEMSGTVHFQSVLDGVTRISTYHRSSQRDLVMLVARGQQDVIAPWRAEAMWRMSIVASLTAIMAILGLSMIRGISTRQRLLGALSTREAEFRLLAESSNDVVSRINVEGRLTYVSPSSINVLGWSPNALVGHSALAGIQGDDRIAVDGIVQELRLGKRSQAMITYRTQHLTKGTIWLESSLSVTRDARSTLVDGVVAISRDVTEQKEREGQLSRWASVDSLTGLANRRALDTCVARELDNTRLGGGPLSLILIDADHFKAYNDTYGHLAGDHCLQQIASVIHSHATRISDVAARYGGEEFALLLPGTDEQGALVVAERIRNAIIDLELPHEGNSAAKVVTVSIGAMAVNRGESITVQDLVGRADRGLYAAKQRGRNRVCTSNVEAPPLQSGPTNDDGKTFRAVPSAAE